MDNLAKIEMLLTQVSSLSSDLADLRARVVKLEAAQASGTVVVAADLGSILGTVVSVKVK